MDIQQMADIDDIAAWFKRPRTSGLNKDRVMELYFTFHPRTAFLKTLPTGAAVVDIGAGDGSLTVFRKWPEPERRDLKLYAYSIEKGRHFDDFDGFEISDWNASPPDFGGRKFDAIVCAHFIEHIADPMTFVAWAAGKLEKGGRIYLEWPSPNSLNLPSRTRLEAVGVPLIISRFDDDHTHRGLPDRDAMIESMLENGFRIEAQGLVRLPWLEDEMLAHFRDADDGFSRQAAFWSYTGWSQYLVVERC
jgi:SAM-dependent methyltransferase